MDLINWQLSVYVSVTCTLTLFSCCEGWIHHWCRDPAVTMVSHNMQNLPTWAKILKNQEEICSHTQFSLLYCFLDRVKEKEQTNTTLQILIQPRCVWSNQCVFQSYLVYLLRKGAKLHFHIFFHFSTDPSMATMELTLYERGPGNCPRASSSSGQYTLKQKWWIWVWMSHRFNKHGDMYN